MRIPHLNDIWNQLLRQLPVGIKSLVLTVRVTHPGARVNLINSHRLCKHILHLCARRHPFGIAPLKMVNIRHHRCRARPELTEIRERIRLVKTLSLFRLDQILILCALFHSRNEKLVDPHRLRLKAFHLVPGLLPVIKRTHNPDFFCVRRPQVKACALSAILLRQMCPKFTVDVVVCCLAE